MADNLPHRDRDPGMAKPAENRPLDGEDEDEEIDETAYKAVKDAVLFAIDVSPSMLELAPGADSKKEERDSATSAALKCAYHLMQQRIISNPRDMMGILLFGTEQSKFQDDQTSTGTIPYPHCYLLSDLDIPEAADVKRLRSLVEDEEEAKKLLVPSTEQVAMSNVLFCANQVFTTKAPNFSSRRLFLVTDNDSPHANSKELRSSAIVRAKDLYDLGVTIELFPISRPDHDFDRSKFYDDIVYRSDPSDPEAPAPVATAAKAASSKDGISLLQSLLSSINSRSPSKRAQFSNIPLELSPDFRITVKGYIIFKRQEKQRTCFIWLDGETPQIAVGSTTRMAEDTARTVDKPEIRKAFKFGGENVTFTPEELTALRNFGEPVIRLIGFKDLEMLPIWANLRPSTFIYPSEDEYIGSTRTFSALQQTMLRKKKLALVWYIPRRNAVPFIAALLPGKEELNEKGEQWMPDGMWVVPVPYADDVRTNPEMHKLIRAPDSLTDKMREVIQQLQLPKAVYDPLRYSNPALQWHYRILQAMALEEDLPEKPQDNTIPRYRQIHKRAGPYVLEWGEMLEKEYMKWQRDNAGQHVQQDKKRPASSAGGGATKLAKTSSAAHETGVEVSDNEMRKRYKLGTVNRYTVAVLKDWLSGKGEVATSGLKKQELVDMVERHFENKMQVD